MKFEVELYLDGYNSEKEMEEACKIFIYEQLNFSGSGVTIREIKERKADDRIS